MSLISYRDPESQIIEEKDGFIRRRVDMNYLDSYKQFLNSEDYKMLAKKKIIIETKLGEICKNDFFLYHKKMNFFIYPDEWTFSMLKDAAISHIELNRILLKNNLITIDGSSLNLNFYKGAFVFFDFGSIKNFECNPWQGYDQFCENFLYPLFLGEKASDLFEFFSNSKKSTISLNQIYKVLSIFDFITIATIKYILLPKLLIFLKKNKNTPENKFIIKKQNMLYLMESILNDINKILPKRKKISWKDYNKNIHYSEEDINLKKFFLSDFFNNKKKYKNCIDFGCNTGSYSIIAANFCENVYSLEADEEALDELYLNLVKIKKLDNVHPILSNLDQINYSNGFLDGQRDSLKKRLRPDLIIFYALMHHLVFFNNIPLELVIKFLRDFNCEVIFEFVPEDDKMSLLLKKNKLTFHSYTQDYFEKILLDNNFQILKRTKLKDNDRYLYYLINV
jgi:hypothetical protein